MYMYAIDEEHHRGRSLFLFSSQPVMRKRKKLDVFCSKDQTLGSERQGLGLKRTGSHILVGDHCRDPSQHVVVPPPRGREALRQEREGSMLRPGAEKKINNTTAPGD